MTRFDLPTEIADVLKVAVEIKLIDVLDIYAMATEHNDNWPALVDELVGYGYATIHEGRNQHSAIVKAAEIFWKLST